MTPCFADLDFGGILSVEVPRSAVVAERHSEFRHPVLLVAFSPSLSYKTRHQSGRTNVELKPLVAF